MGTLTLRMIFKKALSAYERGNLAEAASLCKLILAAKCYDIGTLQLLGTVQLRSGHLTDALATYDSALIIKQDDPDTLNNRGIILKNLNRFEEALSSYDRAIAMRPDFVKALHNRANLLVIINRLEEAVATYDKLLGIAPHHVQALIGRAGTQVALQRFEEALSSYDKALTIEPDNAETLYNRGNVLRLLERFEEALICYDKALVFRENFAEALNNRGNALEAIRCFQEALASYDKALAVKPNFVEALNNRGNALRGLKRLNEALASHDKALSVRPDFPEALNNRAAALAGLRRFEDALASCDKALTIKPDYVDALYNRGNALIALNRFDEALASYDRDLTIRPDHAEAFSARGKALEALRRFDEALASYDQAISINSNLASAHFRKSECLLLRGDLDRGWPEYEWRRFLPEAADERRTFRQPVWRGDVNLREKTVFIYSEQGFGDTIQFCRFAKLLSRHAGKIILEVQPELGSLISSIDPGIDVITRGTKIPRFDYHSPLMSLPVALKTTLDNIPNQVPYLSAPELKTRAWHNRMGKRANPKIGLVWAGNPRKDLQNDLLDRQRSIVFDQLAPLFDSTECEFYSLQKGEEAVTQLRRSALRKRVVDCTGDLHDFSDTAALVENLDLVVTVDTSVAHLAGALGRPFWLINRYNTCWRWLLDREDSPWYPTARVFRQLRCGDWATVVDRIAVELRRWSAAQRANAVISLGVSPELPAGANNDCAE